MNRLQIGTSSPCYRGTEEHHDGNQDINLGKQGALANVKADFSCGVNLRIRYMDLVDHQLIGKLVLGDLLKRRKMHLEDFQANGKMTPWDLH